MRPRTLTLLLLLLVCALAFPRGASASSPLRLREVLDSVRGTHPELERAELKVEAADGRVLSARGGFDPMLSIGTRWLPVGNYRNGQVDALVRQATPILGLGVYGGYRMGWGSYPVYKGDLQTLSGGEVRAGLELPLWKDRSIDERRAEIARARLRRGGADHARDAAQLQLERDAADAYWRWVAAGWSLRVARDLLAIAERRDLGLREQVAAGSIEALQVVDNRRLVLDRRAKVIAAERRFQEASLALSLFARDRRGQPQRFDEDRVPDVLPEPAPVDVDDLEAAVERAIARRPDVAALQAERDAAAVAVRLTRNQRAPKVNLQTFVAKDFGAGPDELAPVEWGAGVVVEVPLPLRAARGEHRVAKAELAGVEAQRRAQRDAIGAQVRTAHVGLRAAHRGVELAREQLEAANELADAERTRLREGSSELVIVNLREIAAAEAALAEIESLADYQRAVADFHVATGRSPPS